MGLYSPREKVRFCRKTARWPWAAGPIRTALVLTAVITAQLGPLVGPVHADNTLPVAVDASYAIEPGEQIDITLEASDADLDPLDFIITALPGKGTVSVGSTTIASGDLPYTIPGQGNSITYASTEDTHGQMTITFKANDGTGDSNAAAAAILVNLSPVEVETTLFTEPNTDLKLTFPAEDPDGDSLSFTIISLPGHGLLKTGSTSLTDDDVPFEAGSTQVTFSPDQDYHGPDQFDFTATDGNLSTDVITASIQVNTTPLPDDLSVTVLPDGTVTIELTSTDADKDPVWYVVASLPAHGTLSAAGGPILEEELPALLALNATSVVYSVEPDYRGTDSFHYRVQDEVSQSDRAVVTIAVNTPPVSPDATLTVAQDGTVEGTLTPTDADGDSLVIRVSRLPENGTLKLDGTRVSKTETEYALEGTSMPFTYTPDEEVIGTDSFAWVANDGKEDSSAGEVTITVTGDAQTPADDSPPDDSPAESETTPDSTSPADENGTDSSPAGETGEVMAESEPPPASAPLCGPFGVVEALAATLALFIAPRTSFRREPRGKYPIWIV